MLMLMLLLMLLFFIVKCELKPLACLKFNKNSEQYSIFLLQLTNNIHAYAQRTMCIHIYNLKQQHFVDVKRYKQTHYEFISFAVADDDGGDGGTAATGIGVLCGGSTNGKIFLPNKL